MINNEKLNQVRHSQMREWLLLFRHFQNYTKQGFKLDVNTVLPQEQYDLAFEQIFLFWQKNKHLKLVVLEKPEDEKDAIILKGDIQTFKLFKA